MDNEPLLPLDERFRNAEQYALDLQPPRPHQPPPPPDVEEDKPCGNVGFCYCPKCNPR